MSPTTQDKPTQSIANSMEGPPVIANGALSRPQMPISAAGTSATKVAPDSLDYGVLEGTRTSFNDLSLGLKPPNVVVNGSGSAPIERPPVVINRESGSDDSQRADSSSELGTKPPSLDGRALLQGQRLPLTRKNLFDRTIAQA